MLAFHQDFEDLICEWLLVLTDGLGESVVLLFDKVREGHRVAFLQPSDLLAEITFEQVMCHFKFLVLGELASVKLRALGGFIDDEVI